MHRAEIEEGPPAVSQYQPSNKLKLVSTILPPSSLAVPSIANAIDLPIVWHLEFHPDGSHLSVCYGLASANGTTRHNDDDRCHFPSHSGNVGIYALNSPIISSFCWAASDHGPLPTSTIHSRTVRCASFSPVNGQHVACAGFDGIVSVWSFPARRCVATLDGHESEVKSVQWSSDGSSLASCGRDKTVWVWERIDNADSGSGEDAEVEFECVSILNGHTGDIKTLRFVSCDLMLSGGYDGTIRAWAMEERTEDREVYGSADEEWYGVRILQWNSKVKNVDNGTVWDISATPEGSRLAVGTEGGTVQIWRRSDGKDMGWEEAALIDVDIHGNDSYRRRRRRKPVYSLDIGSARGGHGRIVVGGALGIVVYREACSSTMMLEPSNGLGSSTKFYKEAYLEPTDCHGVGMDVNCVRWHPINGNMMVSGGDDGTVKVWEFDPR